MLDGVGDVGRVGHSLLSSAPAARVDRLDWSVRLEVGANIAPETPWSQGNLQGKIVLESGQPGLSGRFTGKPAWLWKLRSGNFEHSFRDARGGRSEVNPVPNANAPANGWRHWLARTRRSGRSIAGAVQSSFVRGGIVRRDEAPQEPILKHSLPGPLGRTGSEF